MTLPRCPPPPNQWVGDNNNSTTGSSADLQHSSQSNYNDSAGSNVALESDLELLGRTVHAVSSALTEPPKEGDKYMIYDVSFNPKGCVWDALIVVQLQDEDDDDDKSKGSRGSRKSRGSRGGSRSRSRSKSKTRSADRGGGGGGGTSDEDANGDSHGWDMNQTFSFPIRVTCAEDDDYDDPPPPPQSHSRSNNSDNHNHPLNVRRAKTYAVDLSVIDDAMHHPISRWTSQEAAEHREDIKNAMEWVSYGIRRSMARSMFPKFPEGCQGKPFREVYQLNKKLKSGTFSTVCRGVHRATGRQVAVKCILRKKIEPSVDAAVFEEVLIMSGLHHRYICPMIDYFEEDRCHFVVMELEKGGDLCERLNDKQTYAEPEARVVVRNICEAMEFVHSRRFAHCDIKPRNYLLRSKRDDVDVRLADFGFAQHVHAPNSLTSQCGTPFFVAPEVINRKPYDQQVDMWSIGVTTYLLLCGETPFNGKNRQQLFRRISCDEPTFPDDKWGHISDEGVDFVRKLLTKDPAKRLTAQGALHHRWLADVRHQSKSSHDNKSSATVDQPSEDFSETTDNDARRGRGDPPLDQQLQQHAQTAAYTSRNSNALLGPSRSNSSNNSVPPPARKSRSSASRSPTRATASRPPPPPPPQSHGHGVGSSAQASDENARLLDVIKEQDAKIEALERMVKRMLEPEGAVHEC
eukprot:CAMPEP_0171332994 /NCGR_PEP_ID=MMETSP0878-20121228/3740_1 /TAXON_ID=67004 /ORGANISM="Thalassiosira weissflogii, Strain CCMP1336" /LENGTH=688 /DNA_ID=CAMNT_0011833867 /DNA_START=114 /DNA_END=2180 /DNA_ORIENTATION=-